MESNDDLVDYLVEREYIETDLVEKAFREVDRRNFVPEPRRKEAYRDRPVPLEEDATVSAPHMVAINTELLELEGGEKILEIGSGSGYQLAILSEIASEAVGVERKKTLVEESLEVLENRENVKLIHGDDLEALEKDEVFDRILYSCGVDTVEPAKKRLESDGVIVAPVNTGRGQMLRKFSGDEVEDVTRVRFVGKKKGVD